MKTFKYQEEVDEHPLVEIIPYSKIKEKDILILRCEKGMENQSILKMRSALKQLMIEKDLRILAVTPDLDMRNISILALAAREYQDGANQKEETQQYEL